MAEGSISIGIVNMLKMKLRMLELISEQFQKYQSHYSQEQNPTVMLPYNLHTVCITCHV